MKMQRTRRKQNLSRYLTRINGGFETLETRNLLAANILASADGSIGTAGGSNDVLMTVDLPEAPAGTTATLQISVASTDGVFDPAAVSISDESGNSIPALTSMDDVGSSSSSMTVVDLSAGTYSLTVSDAGTTGSYRVDVSLLGDVLSDDGAVTDDEELVTSAALVQAQGTANFVTAQFYRTRGIDLGVDQYDAGMDVNMNGMVDPHELAMVQANGSVGAVTVSLLPDGEAPVISNLRLVNDTGVSPSDTITTDASLTADIADESAIDAILVSVDGGAEVDVIDMLGGVNGSFTVSQSVLESVNGGPLSGGSHTVAINATDSVGNTTSSPTSTTFILISSNVAPVAAAIPDATATEDAAFSLSISSSFSDADPGDVLTFQAFDLPSWASMNSAGLITGTPANEDVGSSTVTITAIDSQGLSASRSFSLTVENVNDPPVVGNIPNQNAPANEFFSLDIFSFIDDVDADDIVGVNVDVTVDQFLMLDNGVPIPEDLPDWLEFDAATGILSGTPAESDVGTIQLVVFAVDSSSTDFNTFDLTVDFNNSPVLQTPIPDATIDQGQPFSLDLNDFFVDNDPGDSLSFTTTLVGGGNLPSWLTANANGTLSGTPGNDDIGSFMVEATATDSQAASTSDQFMITVNNVNDAPTMADQTFAIPMGGNGTVVGTIVANDIDAGDTLSFSVTGGSGQSIFDVAAGTGVITIADASQAFSQNSFSLNVTVTDSGGLSAAAVMTLTNGSTNTPPVAADDTAQTLNNESMLTLMSSDLLANDSDADGDTVIISDVSVTSSEGATVTLSTDGSTILYDPTTSNSLDSLTGNNVLVDTFTYTASDGNGGTDTATVSIRVTPALVEFTTSFTDLEGAPVTSVNTGQSYNLVISVQDIRGDDATGVFSAYVDINYDAALTAVDGTFQHSTTYSAGTSGSTDELGLLDEVGGTDGISPLGGDIFEVASIQMMANAAGTASFTGDRADDTILHPVTVFLGTSALEENDILVTENSLTINGSAAAPLGFEERAVSSNPDNPYDVNGDGAVSPLDALLLINELNGANVGYAGILYTDVDGDGHASPIDALLVITELNNPGPMHAAMSASASPGGPETGELAANDAVFADLGNPVNDANSAGSSAGSRDADDDDVEDVDAVMSDFGEMPL